MSEPFIGEIKMVGFSYAPRGYTKCDGQLLSISQNSALFSLFGTTYGGDGRTNFGLPDLRGRVPVHHGQGPGLPNFVQGQEGGAVTHTLTSNEMPSHNHTASHNLTVSPPCDANAANADDPTNAINAVRDEDQYSTGAANETMRTVSVDGSVTIANVGANQAHNNLSPYTVINFVVALVGLFPPRN